ncbi:MAG: adenosine kinase [Spirochaetia bacterium]|nr:adenosine kinase [Spirochaetia bacterium]MCF7940288.1 adenosine kinase [Spirochaetia bacterium]
MPIDIYGVGNPLIDIIVHVSDDDLDTLGIHKGTMHLVDTRRRDELIAFIEGKEITYNCGGSCPNTIITLSSLGIASALGGKVGSDAYGTIYREKLHQTQVQDELRDSSSPTGSSIIMVTPDSERTMNTYLGANREFGPEDIAVEVLKEASFIHFTGYMWDTESQKAATMRALDMAREQDTRISFDIADPFAVSRNREAFLHIITEYADIVFANNEEARILFDNYDAYACARSMGKLCPTAVVKNGKQGSFISHHGSMHRIPVKGKDPVDTTGAGDIYAAGFLYGLSRGFEITACGNTASYLAGEIIGQVGAQFTAQKIQSMLSHIQQMH